MKSKVILNALLLISLLTLTLSAQEKKVAPTSLELYKEIGQADSILFQAFNKQDMITFKAMFAEDLE